MIKLKELRKRSVQIAAALTGSLCFMIVGTEIGWTSPTLPLLLSEDSPIPMTADESSWVVAMLSVGCAVGVLPIPFLTGALGRKTILTLVAIPITIAWIIIIFAKTVIALYIARLLFGICVIITFAVVPMYLTEVSEVGIRGILSSMPQLFYNIGTILEFCLVPYTSYTLGAGISVLFPVLFFLLMLFMPESPYFLLLKGRDAEAEKSLLLLRGHTESQFVQQELTTMKNTVAESLKLGKAPLQDLFMIRGNRRGLFIVLILVLLQAFCGQYAVISYTTQIFQNTSSSLDPNLSAIILGSVQTVASLTMSSLVDRIGRRPLLISSTSGVATCAFVMGVYFYLQDNTDYDLSAVGWLPMVALILFMSFFSLALGVLPFTIMGEVFPANIKGLASSLLLLARSASSVFVTKIFQVMTDNIGADSPFWMFFTCCVAGTVFIAWYLPETMGKPFSDIYQELNHETYPRRLKIEKGSS